MREIKLTQDQIALIDDEDYDLVCAYKWYAHWAPGNKTYYARRRHDINSISLMHRLIFGVEDKKIYIDHINHDTLDNRKENLRIVDASASAINRRRKSNNTSGVKGVYFYTQGGCWRAEITIKNNTIYLGHFPTKEDAILARKIAADIYFGKYQYEEGLS